MPIIVFFSTRPADSRTTALANATHEPIKFNDTVLLFRILISKKNIIRLNDCKSQVL